jgi:hypothetical protein
MPLASVATQCSSTCAATLDASSLAEIEEFLLILPLGADQASATIEHLVAQRLIDDATAKQQLTKKLQQW